MFVPCIAGLCIKNQHCAHSFVNIFITSSRISNKYIDETKCTVLVFYAQKQQYLVSRYATAKSYWSA
jgi:hypothetical protein